MEEIPKEKGTLFMTGRLAGRTALITGATRGIGLGIAEGFAREGADLILAARNADQLAKAKSDLDAHGVRVETAVLDVADRDACFEVVRRGTEAFGGIEVLVNNAGVYSARPFLEYSFEEFHHIQEVNLYGVFHLTQAVLPQMIERRYGKIVNIASTAGKWASRNQSAYNVSKHGVVGLTRCVALEMGRHGITVNAICPGLVHTDLLKEYLEVHAGFAGKSSDAGETDFRARVASGRFLDVSECAHLAVYLASSESDGMTGQSLLLDGGMLFV
jgi:NAD(P)-dependent dehydrogenase (short-subunit alcohol dehydrogenase family)